MNIFQEPFVLQIFFIGFGLILGSFVTMLIHRLYHDEGGIVNGRSRCPQCRSQLLWYSLIPVFSWLVQGGMCKNCGKKISIIYPLTELSFAICFSILFTMKWESPLFWWLFGVVFFLLVLFWYDVRFMTVDRRISIPAIVLAVVWMFFKTPSSSPFSGGEYIPYLLGGLICGGIYAVQYYCSKGRWVGQGDIDLGIFMGLCLGLKLGVLSLFGAYVIGTVFSMFLLGYLKIVGKNPDDWKKVKVPMGAFLMPSLFIFLLWGDVVWSWYWGMIV